jgi:hypothetical protein
MIDFDLTEFKQNLGNQLTRRVSVQQHLQEIGGSVVKPTGRMVNLCASTKVFACLTMNRFEISSFG